MNRRIFGKLNQLLFGAGVVLVALKLLAIIQISWWIPACLMCVPTLLAFAIVTLFLGGTYVGSAVDENPESHTEREEKKDELEERLKAVERKTKTWDK
jgi:hypothetical protein